MRLTDKIAVITGAGSGIGWAAAVRFAAEGARVVVAEPVDEIRASFARRGRTIPEPEGPGIPPLGRPIDIANAALASDEARMTTGQVLSVDGGSTTTRRMPTSG